MIKLYSFEIKIYTISVRKPERKRTPGRLRRRWKGTIKMDLRKTGRASMEPVVGSCEHGSESSGSMKAGNFLISWRLFVSQKYSAS
jgi:hypothetical protein